MILYIHGFRSNGNAYKAQLLKDYFGKENVISLSLKHTPLDDYKLLLNIVKTNPIKLIIGSSMGGFYAHCLTTETGIKSILINPSLYPYNSLMINDIVVTGFDGSKFVWGDENIKELQAIHNAIDYTKLNPKQLYFYLSEDDKVINHQHTIKKYSDISTLKVYSNSGHVFTRFNEILSEIEILHNEI